MPVSIGFVAEFDSEVGKVRTLIENALPVLETLMKVETSNAVDRLVYGTYPPAEYKRRGKNGGGLGDMKNYQTIVQKSRLSVKLENKTTGNPAYQPPASDGWDSGEISDIIESGNGYHWRGSMIYNFPQPRPYLDEAEQKAADDFETGVLIDAYLST